MKTLLTHYIATFVPKHFYTRIASLFRHSFGICFEIIQKCFGCVEEAGGIVKGGSP